MIKIALDLDDVLVDFVGRFIDFHNEEFGTSFEVDKFVYDDGYYQVLNVEPTEVGQRFKTFRKSPHFKKVGPFPYSIPLLEELKSLGHTVHIVTGRDTGRLNETKEFVEKFFAEQVSWERVHFGSDFHEDKNPQLKHEICISEGFNFLVEDSAKHAFECAEAGIKVLLLDKPWNQKVNSHKNIVRIKNSKNPTSEIISHLKT